MVNEHKIMEVKLDIRSLEHEISKKGNEIYILKSKFQVFSLIFFPFNFLFKKKTLNAKNDFPVELFSSYVTP